MLIWAAATIGFFIGVFFTLLIFAPHKREDEIFYAPQITKESANLTTNSVWENFTQLTQINYFGNDNFHEKKTPQIVVNKPINQKLASIN